MHDDEASVARQVSLCQRFGVTADIPLGVQKVGLSRNARSGEVSPLNGLRHSAVGDTSGWYIWAGGEPDTSADFFEPVHVEHLPKLCPQAIPYLGLPPGWRFLVAPDHEDVWRDDSLLRD